MLQVIVKGKLGFDAWGNIFVDDWSLSRKLQPYSGQAIAISLEEPEEEEPVLNNSLKELLVEAEGGEA